MAEDDDGRILGIMPLTAGAGLFQQALYSLPEGASGGLLIRRDLSHSEQEQVAEEVLAHVDSKYGRHCAFFQLKSHISPSNPDSAGYEPLLLRQGFSRIEKSAGYPCTHILPLEQPFEDRIWRGLWSYKCANGSARPSGMA